jgi:hypothetical protein
VFGSIGIFACETLLMSPGYVFLGILFAQAGAAIAVLWYARLLSVKRWPGGLENRSFVAGVPLFCALLMLVVLRNWADHEVRESGWYQAAFLIAWAAMIILAHLVSRLLGLDCLELGLAGRNRAVVWAWAGLLLGTTLAVAGANIGEGPTEATTLGPMIMAVISLLILWIFFAVATRSTLSVTVERDVASGARLAGLLVAWGLILGRSVAGDWVSTGATMQDFWQQGLRPAILLLCLAIPIELWERPRRRRPFPPIKGAGVVPACLFLGFALVWIWCVRV